MKTSCGKLFAAFAAVLVAGAQTTSGRVAAVDQHATGAEFIRLGGNLPTGSVLREIDDPSTGARWLLVRDPAHPEGPGRMVLSALSSVGEGSAAADSTRERMSIASGQARHFVIRAGDALLVEEHSAAVDAQLEAVALGPAVLGAEFRARLRIGGKVVRVSALGPGRATFVDEKGARR
jgi:hypothetical protein